jgi:hypothetical protein
MARSTARLEELIRQTSPGEQTLKTTTLLLIVGRTKRARRWSQQFDCYRVRKRQSQSDPTEVWRRIAGKDFVLFVPFVAKTTR